MVVGLDGRVLLEEFPSGVSQAARELFHALVQGAPDWRFTLFVSGYDVVLMQQRTEDFKTYSHLDIRVVRVPNRALNLTLAFFKFPSLDNLVGGVDVWFSPNIGFLSLKSAKLFLLIHDTTFVQLTGLLTPYTRIWHRLIRPQHLIHSAVQIFTPSYHSQQSIQEYFQVPVKRIQVVPFGPPRMPEINKDTLTSIKQRYHLPDQFCLTVGTLEPRKNIRTLIEAWTPDLGSLVILGAKGWDDLPQSSGVQYIGYVSHHEKWAMLSMASALIYPSLAEGFGLPLLEGFTANVPVIAGPHTSLVEVGQDGVLWTNVHHRLALRAAVRSLLDDEVLRQRLIIRGRQRLQDFTWKRTAELIRSNIYENRD